MKAHTKGRVWISSVKIVIEQWQERISDIQSVIFSVCFIDFQLEWKWSAVNGKAYPKHNISNMAFTDHSRFTEIAEILFGYFFFIVCAKCFEMFRFQGFVLL